MIYFIDSQIKTNNIQLSAIKQQEGAFWPLVRCCVRAQSALCSAVSAHFDNGSFPYNYFHINTFPLTVMETIPKTFSAVFPCQQRYRNRRSLCAYMKQVFFQVLSLHLLCFTPKLINLSYKWCKSTFKRRRICIASVGLSYDKTKGHLIKRKIYRFNLKTLQNTHSYQVIFCL